MNPALCLLESPDWVDYALLDSGNGARLERFGPYTFKRPEHQAIWQPALPSKEWESCHAVFHATSDEVGGKWEFRNTVEEYISAFDNNGPAAKCVDGIHIMTHKQYRPAFF